MTLQKIPPPLNSIKSMRTLYRNWLRRRTKSETWFMGLIGKIPYINTTIRASNEYYTTISHKSSKR